MDQVFRIYYDNGYVYEGSSPRTVRIRHGVICVVQPDPEVGRSVVDGNDWYYCKNGIWFGADTHGILDQMVHFAEQIDCVLQGRMIDRITYQRIIAAACNDSGFPRKSAKRPGCRQGF